MNLVSICKAFLLLIMVKYRNVSSQNGGDTDWKAEIKFLQWISSVIVDQPQELSKFPGSYQCKACIPCIVRVSLGDSSHVRPLSNFNVKYSLLHFLE